jgi:hypothetical protein
MKTGKLFYNPANDRLGINFEDGTRDDGLHCGTPLQALTIGGAWIDTRVEFAAEDWYLVGLFWPGTIPDGLTVRLP